MTHRRTYLPYWDDTLDHLDFAGQAIPRPPLIDSADEDIETRIEHMRSVNAYNDAVIDANSRRFEQNFCKALRG